MVKIIINFFKWEWLEAICQGAEYLLVFEIETNLKLASKDKSEVWSRQTALKAAYLDIKTASNELAVSINERVIST